MSQSNLAFHGHNIELDAPCPCRRGNRLAIACCGVLGDIRRPLATLMPPGPITGYSNPRCYLSVTGNCSEKITAEHYISRSVLAELATEVDMPFPFLPPGQTRRLSINSLTANILCKRHNEALSELDQHARDFFRAMRAGQAHASKRGVSKKTELYLCNGDALELWAAKTLNGLYHSKIASREGHPLKNNFELSRDAFIAALEARTFPAPLGMYAHPLAGQTDDGMSVTPLTLNTNPDVVGLQSRLGVFQADYISTVSDVNFQHLLETSFYRPSGIIIQGAKRKASIVLTWADRVPRTSIVITIKQA